MAARFLLVTMLALALALSGRADAVAATSEPSTPAEDPAPALVMEVQRGLAAIGLYRGAIDGQDSPLLRAAIRSYQQQRDLPVDGAVSTTLLTHLGGVAEQAAALRNRIDATKIRQVEEANLALASAPAIRDRLSAATALDTPDCPEAGLIPCLAGSAIAAAGRIDDGEQRDWVLLHLVGTLARAGWEDTAWVLVRRIGDPRTQISGVRDIAAALAEAGAGDRATDLAAQVPLARPRAEAWIAIALAAHGAGDSERLGVAIAAARQAIGQIDEGHQRVALLARVAPLAAVGDAVSRDIAMAMDLAARLAPGSDRDLAMGHIATAQAALGDLDGALGTITAIADDRRRGATLLRVALAAADAGAWDRAMALPAKIAEPRYRAVALARLAARLAGLGRMDQATQVLEQAEAAMKAVTSPFARDYGIAVITEAWLALGNVDEARRAADGIGAGPIRARTLDTLAAALSSDGVRGDAARKEAAKAVAEIIDPVERLAAEARQALARGDPNAHWRLRGEAEALTDPWQRARALAALIDVLVGVPDAGAQAD